MKPTAKTILSLALCSPLVACNKAEQRPNIVLFLVDDYGWIESSLAFGEQVYPMNERYHTPNMERLASQGAMLTSAYACPVSTPTRTSIMTGMSAPRLGVTSFTSLYKDLCSDAIGGAPGTTNPNLSDPFAHAEWNYNALCPDSFRGLEQTYGLEHTVYATPMVGFLRDAGYHTIHIGKAHWAPAGLPGANPYNMGFMVNVGGASNGHPQSFQGEDNYGNIPLKGGYASIQNMTQYYGTEVHLTEALTMEALKAIETPINRGEPFFLYMAHYATHTPIQPHKRYYQRYLDAGLDPQQAAYASMVEGMDASLGQMLDYLEQKGVADNTIFIFYSDNGGHCLGGDKGGEPHTQNAPLRSGKGSVYEGGIRVPMIVRWAGRITPNTRINTPVNNEDIFPTILEMAGIEDYKTTQQRDGQSLVRLLTKGSRYVATAAERGLITSQRDANRIVVPKSVSGLDPKRPIIVHYPHQYRVEDQDDIDFMSSIRCGDWKLVYRMHDARLELYNLRDDIGERNDVANVNPKIVKQLATTLSDHLREWNAPMPTVRATGKKVPMPDEL